MVDGSGVPAERPHYCGPPIIPAITFRMVQQIAPRFATIDARTVPAPEKRADAFYLSTEWRAFVAELRTKRRWVCEDPQHDATQPREHRRIYPDHIHELKDNGAPLDPANIMLRCPACHTRKTIEERAKRQQRALNLGQP